MVLLVDGGDNISGEKLQDSIKAEYYYEGLRQLGYRVCGLGEMDLLQGQDYIHDLMERKELELICANLHDAESGALFAKPYTVQRIGERKVLGMPMGGVRVGMTSVMMIDDGAKLLPKKPGDRELIVKDPLVAARSAVQELRGKSDIILCIAHTGMNEAKEIARSVGGIDMMLVGHGNYRNKEPVIVGKTSVIQPGDQGRMIAVMEAKVSPQKKVTGVIGTLIALTDTYPDDEPMAKLIADYRTAIRKANIVPEWPDMDKELFVGVETCQGCHTEEHDQWLTTRHAHAWETMVKEEVDTDPECVMCHVTGFGRGNGFRHKDVTPKLINVQCEICHGPGKEHYDLITGGGDRKAKPFHALEPVTEKMCRSCHRDHHDPEFDYAHDIFLVSHRPDELRALLDAAMGNIPGADPAGSHPPASPDELSE